MRRNSFISVALTAAGIAFVACTKESVNDEQAPTTHSISFVASQTQTKTAMEITDGKAYFTWEDADKDNVYIYESGKIAEVEASLDDEGKIMSFLATFQGGSAPVGAVYNAHLNSDITAQNPSASSYDGRCDVLSATKIDVTAVKGGSSEVNINFEREVSVNKMTIKGLGANESISSVILTADKEISGKYVIDGWTETSTTIAIYPDGVVSDETGNAVIYYTCMLVTDAQITVDVTTGEGAAMKTYRKIFAKTISFVKGEVKSFGVTVEPYSAMDETGYFNIENISSKQSRLYIEKKGNAPSVSLEYSRDNGATWQTYSVAEHPYISMALGEKIYLRGHNNTTFGTSNANYIRFVSTSGEGDVKVSGDIMTLLDGDNPPANVPDYGFFGLFSGFNSLKDAESLDLSAKTIGTSAYSNMFMDCNRMTDAPEIGATEVGAYSMSYMFGNCSLMTAGPTVIHPLTLPASACENMFYGCSKLVTAPEIAAETIGESTFNGMFYNCSALTGAPSVIKATTLPTKSCYNMFNGCRALQTPPAMAEGTTAGNQCCAYMFQNCAALRSIPALKYDTAGASAFLSMFNGCKALIDLSSATIDVATLGDSACKTMFMGCTGLTRSPALAASTLNISSCEQMFYNCTSLLEFTGELEAQVMKKRCYYHMFQNCTKLQSVPDIKATSLDESCFEGMFLSCSSLTSAPDLNAETLAKNCYYQMFQYCTSLQTPPAIQARVFADHSCTNMFNGCTKLSSIPDFRSDAVLAKYCFSSMFKDCTGLVDLSGISLNSTTLYDYCYDSMFASCVNLKKGPALPATALPTGCYQLMFDGCSSLVETPAFNATAVGMYSYSSMFRNCTSLVTVAPFKASASGSTYSCDYMFKGCTSITVIPEVPARFMMTDQAVRYMFQGCSGIEDLSG
ncbi:MAG: BspA family leucine-rich repeat surface protein, partial [Bacteroidales bacterium]|nr:BspA family leucine-rich repeat surface protein [Bacteroidales bacterium]